MTTPVNTEIDKQSTVTDRIAPDEQLLSGQLVIENRNAVLVRRGQTGSSADQSLAQRDVTFHVGQQKRWVDRYVFQFTR